VSEVVSSVVELIRAKVDTVNLFNWNARMRHGIPLDESVPKELRVKHEHSGLPKSEPPQEQPVVHISSDAAGQQEKSFDWPGALLKAAAAAGMIGGASGLTYWLTRPTESDTPEQNPPAVVTKEPDGSLLQYLEDTGRHLPRGGSTNE